MESRSRLQPRPPQRVRGQVFHFDGNRTSNTVYYPHASVTQGSADLVFRTDENNRPLGRIRRRYPFAQYREYLHELFARVAAEGALAQDQRLTA
jgi:hypothetical protein